VIDERPPPRPDDSKRAGAESRTCNVAWQNSDTAPACDQIEQDNPSATQRRMAHELKLYCATSAFDIASNPDPYTSLLDMTLSVGGAVTVQSGAAAQREAMVSLKILR